MGKGGGRRRSGDGRSEGIDPLGMFSQILR